MCVREACTELEELLAAVLVAPHKQLCHLANELHDVVGILLRDVLCLLEVHAQGPAREREREMDR